jgi:hypothetical protein
MLPNSPRSISALISPLRALSWASRSGRLSGIVVWRALNNGVDCEGGSGAEVDAGCAV